MIEQLKPPTSITEFYSIQKQIGYLKIYCWNKYLNRKDYFTLILGFSIAPAKFMANIHKDTTLKITNIKLWWDHR